MKKVFTLLLLFLLFVQGALAYEEIDGLFYDFNHANRTAFVTHGSKTYSGSKTIPDYITTKQGMEYSVIAIGEDAFANCYELTDVKIATSITTIGANAFKNCTRLTSIKFPNAVDSIGNAAFHGCM